MGGTGMEGVLWGVMLGPHPGLDHRPRGRPGEDSPRGSRGMGALATGDIRTSLGPPLWADTTEGLSRCVHRHQAQASVPDRLTSHQLTDVSHASGEFGCVTAPLTHQARHPNLVIPLNK